MHSLLVNNVTSFSSLHDVTCFTLARFLYVLTSLHFMENARYDNVHLVAVDAVRDQTAAYLLNRRNLQQKRWYVTGRCHVVVKILQKRRLLHSTFACFSFKIV